MSARMAAQLGLGCRNLQSH